MRDSGSAIQDSRLRIRDQGSGIRDSRGPRGRLRGHMSSVFSNSRGAGVLVASVAALAISIVPVRPAAQGGQAAAPQAPAPVINQSDDPLLRSFRFRSIGPASMGGRIDDIAVSETDPNVIYLGYAVGG